MEIKIALAGNPNSGKTTMFNDLTGSNQHVGNWPGVTVEKKEGRLRGHRDVIIQDLPGIYSLSPYTLEEVVSRTYLVKERPDTIINIVDGTNIERNLYLTTSLLELGIPVLVALNMADLVKKSGDRIDISKLSRALGCPVIETDALKGQGSMEAAEAAIVLAREKAVPAPLPIFDSTVERAIESIERLLEGMVSESLCRWYAVKLFERDEGIKKELSLSSQVLSSVEKIIKSCEDELDDDAESIITSQRYAFIGNVVSSAVKKRHVGTKMSASDKIDKVVTNRILALPIFAAVMFLVYYIAMGTLGAAATDWTNDVLVGEYVQGGLSSFFESINVVPWLSSLVVDGIVGGVGAVIGFVPQMIVLFFLLSILEDVGYMARVAFIMDRIFRRFGLSGKSFIPMLVGVGCGVPGVMASRTIENEKDRRMTIMTTTFIPCGAKVPIIGLIAGSIFGGSGLVAVSAYFIGIAAIIVSGIMLKKTKPFAGDPAPFVMELPAYHIPSYKNVLSATWERGWSFIKRAGTVILLSTVIIWVLNSLTFEGGLHYIGDGDEQSVLNLIGSAVAFIFKPLGFGTWEAAVATFLGLVAKEEVVGFMGTLSGMDPDLAMGLAEEGSTQLTAMGQLFFGGSGIVAYSFLIFNLLCAPCFAAMGAIKREMNSSRWTAFAISYQCGLAYAVSLMVYQFGTALTGGGFTLGTAAACAVGAFMLFMLLRKNPYGSRKTSSAPIKANR